MNILILGGGFGGVRAALDLSKKFKHKKDIKIILVDKHDAHTFYPSLYEVASVFGMKHEHPFHTRLYNTILLSYKEIFKGAKNVEIVQAEIKDINLEEKQVSTSGDSVLSFDYLIIALGSVVSTFGIPGVQEYAFKFKSIEDAVMLNDKIEELYDLAGRGTRTLPINILVGGAGFTGVELAAELSNCTVHIAHRHKVTQQNCTSISLIEAAPMMLPMVSEKERNIIRKRLTQIGVNIMENSAIEEVGPDFIKLKSGQMLNGDLIVWTAGIKAMEFLKNIKNLDLDERGRILVNNFLQIKNHQNIYAVGDNIIFLDPKNQKPVPQMAYVAIEQGRVVAENIARSIQSKGKSAALKLYKPDYGVWVAPVGGKYAVAHLGAVTFSGFVGYVIHELIDLRYLFKTLPFPKAIKLFFKNLMIFSRND